VFLHHALDLLQVVAVGAIRAAGIELKDIGAIVVNTITGVAIPSLDAKLMNRLDLPALRSSGCQSSGSAAAVALPDLHAPPAMRRRCPELTFCFSPSIFAVSAFVSTIRAWPCSCRQRCPAMAPRASCCATPRARGP
jgi:hypothetical protein